MKDEDKIIYSRRNNVVDSVVNNLFVEILPFHHFFISKNVRPIDFLNGIRHKSIRRIQLKWGLIVAGEGVDY